MLKRIPDEDNPIVLAAAKVIIDEKGFPAGKTRHQYDNVLWNIGVG
jgi:hypothetical protein